MENITFKMEFTYEEMTCILVGLNSFIKNLNYHGIINEDNVKAYKNAFDVSSSLYIKLASYIELTDKDNK